LAEKKCPNYNNRKKQTLIRGTVTLVPEINTRSRE
jgi:hypothetical protein